MKKSKISGWKAVYRFTIEQNIKNKAYIISTVVITLFVALLCIGINILPAILLDSSGETKASKIDVETVYVYDNSGLAKIEYGDLVATGVLPNVKLLSTTVSKEYESSADGEDKKVVMIDIEPSDDAYIVKVTVPEGSSVTDKDAKTVGNIVSSYFRSENCKALNLTEEQVDFNDLPIKTSTILLGEEKANFIVLFVQYFVNVGLVLVFMLLINSYGKMASSVVAMEKSSKVMELLLTSVRPVATIVGKIFAMSTLLVGQLLLWIVTGVAFYFGSNVVLNGMNSKYANGLSEAFDLLKSAGIKVNLSPLVLLLAIAILVTGFTVYMAVAGFVGATVSKIEELGQAIQSFAFLAVVGAYIPLFGCITMISTGATDTPLLNISRILPICSLYLVPSELILGTNTITAGFISLAINVATLTILMLFIGKVYESVILHSGSRLKLKDILKMSKNN